MSADEPRATGTGPPGPLVVDVTDPLGRRVWMAEEKYIEKRYKHDELRDPALIAETVSDPEAIHRHIDLEDRRIYVGYAWDPPDIQDAAPRPYVIVSESTRPEPGGVLTAYVRRRSGWPETLGAVEWRASGT